jgi:hypothetical protein
VKENELYGFIGTEGQMLIPFQYSMAMPFNSNGEARVATKNAGYQTFLINKQGKILREEAIFDEHEKEMKEKNSKK